MNNFLVYVHKKATTGEIFYVGKGLPGREVCEGSRNNHWRAIAAKHGWFAEVVAKDLSEQDSFALEIKLIAEYRKAYKLANKTAGGEGLANPDAETRRKISESNKGKVLSQEAREKISRAHKGKKISEEARKNMSAAAMGNQKFLGKKHSAEVRRKQSEKRLGMKFSEEHKRRLSEMAKRTGAGFKKGHELSMEAREKISKANKGNKFATGKRSPEACAKIAAGIQAYWTKKKAEQLVVGGAQ